MTAEELAELRKVASAATPGPWDVGRHGDCYVAMFEMVGDKILGSVTHRQNRIEPWKPNAAHIAAFNPATALRLLDRIEKLERVREAAKNVYNEGEYCAVCEHYGHGEDLEDALRAALDACEVKDEQGN